MRLITEPKNKISAIADSALTIGKPAYLTSAGKLKHPTDASTAAKAVYFVNRPPEYCVNFDGYSNVIAAGDLVEGVNGFIGQFTTPELNIADNFAAVDPGTTLGITNSGAIAKEASAAANTTGLLRLIKFVGDTNSGVMDAIVDFRN